MPEPQLEFKHFFEAMEHGATRSRNLVQLLMLGTFLTFLGLYNSLRSEWNWLGSRVDSHHIAAEWVGFSADKNQPKERILLLRNGTVVDTLLNRFTCGQFTALTKRDSIVPFNDTVRIARLRAAWAPNVLLHFPAHVIHDSVRTAYNDTLRCVDWGRVDRTELTTVLTRLAGFRCHDKDELERVLAMLKKAQVDNALLIKMPILGINFDVNGLAIMCGLAFSILYFLLYYAMARELKNIKLLFTIHDQFGVDNRGIYQLLSMYQVLTIPRSIDRFIIERPVDLTASYDMLRRDSNKYKRWFPMVPVILPVIVCGVVIVYDLSTQDVGYATNAALTISYAIGSLLIWLFVFAGFMVCLRCWLRINKQWDKKAREVVRELRDATRTMANVTPTPPLR